jgi:hypothetical protein
MVGDGAPTNAEAAYRACGLNSTVPIDLAERTQLSVQEIHGEWVSILAAYEEGRVYNPQGVLVSRVCKRCGVKPPKGTGKLSPQDAEWMSGIIAARRGRHRA